MSLSPKVFLVPLDRGHDTGFFLLSTPLHPSRDRLLGTRTGLPASGESQLIPNFISPLDHSGAVVVPMELDGVTPCSLGADFHPRNNTPGGYTPSSTLRIADPPRGSLYAEGERPDDRTSIAMQTRREQTGRVISKCVHK